MGLRAARTPARAVCPSRASGNACPRPCPAASEFPAGADWHGLWGVTQHSLSLATAGIHVAPDTARVIPGPEPVDGKSVIFDEIELSDLSVAECSTKNVNHSFQCITPFRSLVLAAESRREMEEWIAALKSATSTTQYYEGTEQVHSLLSGQHNWYATSHARPTYCNVCREALSGVTSHGLSCEVCKLKAHKRCAAKALNNCKWTTLASVGKDIIEDEDGVSGRPALPAPAPLAGRAGRCIAGGTPVSPGTTARNAARLPTTSEHGDDATSPERLTQSHASICSCASRVLCECVQRLTSCSACRLRCSLRMFQPEKPRELRANPPENGFGIGKFEVAFRSSEYKSREKRRLVSGEGSRVQTST
ncbi:uncharacterized protein LOC134774613 [Penaeus indicus]|uniref:uncharacterized protein LOC134774613 n=1 Tax=Penaeus indicus TaxID=29960 RepID=UPI00300D4D65